MLNPSRIAIVGGGVAGGYVFLGASLTHWLPEPREGSLKESET